MLYSMHMADNHKQFIEDIKGWAVEAGAYILRFAQAKNIDIQTKSDGSRVTEADLAAENFLLERFAKHYPSLSVIAEEAFSRGDAPKVLPGDTYVLIDALDGTKPFLKGKPDVTVNIALVEKGRAVLGVIYAPFFGKLYYTQGGQAYKQEDVLVSTGDAERIQCRSLPSEGAIFIASRDLVGKDRELYDVLPMPKSEFVTLGSSLKFCYIAEGLADIYIRPGRTCHWDTAAGQAILRAAGGEVFHLEQFLPQGNLDSLGYDPKVEGLYNPEFIALTDDVLKAMDNKDRYLKRI